jgi:UPF0716 protein FxsA
MKLRVVLVAYPLVEISAAYGVALFIGWAWTIALLITGIPIGWFITKRAGRDALREGTELLRNGDIPAMRDLGLLPAGILILIPGFVTDLLGSLLCIPQVRSAIWGQRISRPGGQVIQGHIIDQRDEPFN